MPSLQSKPLQDIATLPPVMSARLRHVLAIVEEIEAHCITVQTVDAMDLDGTSPITLYIDAGADLEGEQAEIFDLDPSHEVRWMKYGGVRVEWAFDHPANAAVIAPTPDEDQALEAWLRGQHPDVDACADVDMDMGMEVAHG